MTDYKPRPGVDAVTRDGRRVTGLEVENDSLVGAVEIPYYERMIDRWDFNGKNISSRKFDLVADAPPLPEVQHGPVRTKTVTVADVTGVRRALEIARRHIVTLGGEPEPDDPYADAIQRAVLREVDAAADTLRQIAEAMDE